MNNESETRLFHAMTVNESFREKMLDPDTRWETIKQGHLGEKFDPDKYDEAIVNLIGRAAGIEEFINAYRRIKDNFNKCPSLIAVPCNKEYTNKVIELMGQKSREILKEKIANNSPKV